MEGLYERKKVLSVLLASVMMFTAVPAGNIGAMAAPVQNAQEQEQKVNTQIGRAHV